MRLNYLPWLAAYLVIVAATVCGLLAVRHWSLENAGTPEAQAQWDAWREEASRQAAGSGPVMRRVPRSDQPPLYVLMSEHFAICLAAALVFITALSITLMVFLRGVFSASAAIRQESKRA